jgi:hypothetical protein
MSRKLGLIGLQADRYASQRPALLALVRMTERGHANGSQAVDIPARLGPSPPVLLRPHWPSYSGLTGDRLVCAITGAKMGQCSSFTSVSAAWGCLSGSRAG